jgi:hypothetical protein
VFAREFKAKDESYRIKKKSSSAVRSNIKESINSLLNYVKKKVTKINVIVPWILDQLDNLVCEFGGKFKTHD